MSKTFVNVKVLAVPHGAVWQQLKQIIEDANATTVGLQEYEFRSYGDAIVFQATCRDLNVTYEVNDLSED